MSSIRGGWVTVLGSTSEAVRLFRISLGILLTLELSLRFRFLEPFYSEEGTLPLSLLMPKVDEVYHAVCLHCHLYDILWIRVLLGVQVFLALLYTLGVKIRLVGPVTWYLYFSLTLRNTWMNYILDRYFHYLLFVSMFLPYNSKQGYHITPGTIALKLLVFWIYFDAGYNKYMDQGWSYGADPLPALDTYARHTLVAQYLYAIVGPAGLRLMTPVVVWVELLAAPVTLLGSYLASGPMVYFSVSLIWSLHVGIALTLRNSALLSFVACTAWFPFLPTGSQEIRSRLKPSLGTLWSILLLCSMVAGSFWLETLSRACDQSVKHIWSTLLHNRWNVFTGAEEYVSWEIAPGLLQDGSVVDVWGKRNDVSWKLPGGGAPCTATSRPGRWRSFPYLAGLEGEDGDALWSYLCREWDRENQVDLFPGRKLVRYNFFMLQADVLPEMAFSATRKRHIITYECVPSDDDSLLHATAVDADDEHVLGDGDSNESSAETVEAGVVGASSNGSVDDGLSESTGAAHKREAEPENDESIQTSDDSESDSETKAHEEL